MSTEIEVRSEIEKVLDSPRLMPMKSVYAGIGLIVTRLSSFVIKKQDDYELAMQALKDAKESILRVDVAYEEAAGKEEAHVKKAKDAYKMITGPIDLGMKDLKQKMAKFQYDQEEKRRKEAENLRLKAIEEAKKLEEANTVKEQEKIETKVQKIEAKAEAIEVYKPKTADKVRKFEVINPDEVERQYCSPEEKKIRPFIGRPGDPLPLIKGVRIWDEVKIVTR